MNPAASSFASSFLMASHLSGEKRRNRCFFGNWESDRANWCRGIPGDDAVERSLAWSKQTHVVEAHLCQRACKDQVEPTSAVDEYSSKLGALDDWNEY